jgi:transcriptional regulator with XRE-family HTH domain
MTTETVGARVRLLRVAMGMTQEALAEAAGLDRPVMVQIESGRNQATSYAIRAALALGADVPLEALAEYLDGHLLLRGLVALRGMRAASQWWRPIADAASSPSSRPEVTQRSVAAQPESTTPSKGSEARPKRAGGRDS